MNANGLDDNECDVEQQRYGKILTQLKNYNGKILFKSKKNSKIQLQIL
jgi:hypothetical protein